MLTQNRRSRGRALRYFLTLPLIAALVAGFSVPGHTDEWKWTGNKVEYRGNEFVMSDDTPTDTVIVEDPVTGNQQMMVTRKVPKPLTMNGRKIYDQPELVRGAVYEGSKRSATAEYFEKAKSTLAELPDGIYNLVLGSVVVDEKGKLVFFEGVGIYRCANCKANPGELSAPWPQKESPDDFRSLQELTKKLSGKLEAPLMNDKLRFKPAEFNGQAVPSILTGDLDFFKDVIVVSNHKANLRPR